MKADLWAAGQRIATVDIPEAPPEIVMYQGRAFAPPKSGFFLNAEASWRDSEGYAQYGEVTVAFAATDAGQTA